MNAGAGVLEIDLTALAANYTFLKNQVGADCLLTPAVKANAYGTGIAEAAPALYAAGARRFFVATLGEALELRDVMPQIEIGVLGGLMAGAAGEFAAHNLIPVLNDAAQIQYWADENKRSGLNRKSILHIDTGMNRLGLGAADLKAVLGLSGDIMQAASIETVMSHFACADEKFHPLNEEQFKNFSAAAKAHFPWAKKSLANSSGIMRDKKYHFDAARPGMALYGLNPTPEMQNPMRAVVKLSAPVLQVRMVKKGQSAGYAAGYVFENDTACATIGIGYADGFSRHLSGKGQLFWNGIACPILGRVSMDLTILDIGHIPEDKRPAPGDMVEVLGPHQDADTLAAAAGTIGYEILTQLGRRYTRHYIRP